jgi:hypothetical protein
MRVKEKDLYKRFSHWAEVNGKSIYDPTNPVHGAVQIDCGYGRFRIVEHFKGDGAIKDLTGYQTKKDLYLMLWT